MSETPGEQLIALRLQQARESLGEADALYQYSFWRGVINRSYYAMFYAILALAVTQQVTTSKHSGVIAFFDREYIKRGIFPRELSRSLHFAFEKRQSSDYGEVFTVSKEEAFQSLEEARRFVAGITDYLQSNPSKSSNTE